MQNVTPERGFKVKSRMIIIRPTHEMNFHLCSVLLTNIVPNVSVAVTKIQEKYTYFWVILLCLILIICKVRNVIFEY